MEEKESTDSCKRPYDLGKRREASDRVREAVIAAARAQLESGGVRELTMDSLARASGVTRQTIHNLFGTRNAVLEALFDRMALDAGMQRMRDVMMKSDGRSMLAAFVEVFVDFWSRDRMLLRRIHGLAAIEPEFGRAIDARNERRKMAAARVVATLARENPIDAGEQARRAAVLVALTSFEFFDVLAESCGNIGDAASAVHSLVRIAITSDPPRT